ncbi:hypothetical protein LSAT2_018153 [Lamellibrachia satsuma]|nr:hypothetical protein LSAT2_018153 [Lamellibrachia satsuma]
MDGAGGVAGNKDRACVPNTEAPSHSILFALTGATGSHSLNPLHSNWCNRLPLTQSSSLSLEQQAPTHSILFTLTGATGSHSLNPPLLAQQAPHFQSSSLSLEQQAPTHSILFTLTVRRSNHRATALCKVSDYRMRAYGHNTTQRPGCEHYEVLMNRRWNWFGDVLRIFQSRAELSPFAPRPLPDLMGISYISAYAT